MLGVLGSEGFRTPRHDAKAQKPKLKTSEPTEVSSGCKQAAGQEILRATACLGEGMTGGGWIQKLS